MSEGAKMKSLTWILPTVVVIGLVLAVFIPVSGAWEAVTAFLVRWFFAVFCALYAVVQGRVYFMLRRRKVSDRAAEGVPVGAHGLFTIVWSVFAVAAVVYGVVGLDGWLETAGWIAIGSMICIQLLVLGRLDPRIGR